MVSVLEIAINASGAKRGADQVVRQQERIRKSSRQTRDELGRFTAGTGKAGGAANALGLNLRGLVGGFTALAVIRSTVSTIASFETAIVTLGGVSGATADELERLEVTARNLGAATAFTASQAAEGLINLSRAGFEVGESIDAIEPVLNLAIAQQLELGQSSEFVAASLRGFRLEAEDASDVAAILSNQANSSATDVNLLGSALSFTAATANLSGSDLAETSAAIGVLSDNAIRGSRAGTNLNQIFLKLAKPTSEAARLFQLLGVELDDVNPEKVGLTTALDNLGPVLQSNAAAATIFGARNAGAARILAANTDAIRAQTEENRNLGDELQELADNQLATLDGKYRTLKSAIEEVSLSLGDSGLGSVLKGFLDVLTEAVRGVDDLVDAFDKLVDRNDTLKEFLSAFDVASAIEDADKRIELLASGAGFNTLDQRVKATQQNIEALRSAIERDGPRPLLLQLLERAEQRLEDLGAAKRTQEIENLRDAIENTPERVPEATKETIAAFDMLNEKVNELAGEALEGARDKLLGLFRGASDGADETVSELERVEAALAKIREEQGIGGSGGGGNAEEEERLRLQEAAGASLARNLQFLEDEEARLRLGNEEFEKRIALRELLNLTEAAGIPISDELIQGYQDQIDEIEALAQRREVFAELGNAIAGGVGDALRTLRDEGKLTGEALEGIFQSVIDQLFEVFVVQQITGFVQSGVNSLGGFGGGNAQGNAFNGGSVVPFQSGGVVTGPTLFGMSGGRTGLMGEAGPEAILPLARDSKGNLGVAAASGGGGGNNINLTQIITTPDANSFRKTNRQQLVDLRRNTAVLTR